MAHHAEMLRDQAVVALYERLSSLRKVAVFAGVDHITIKNILARTTPVPELVTPLSIQMMSPPELVEFLKTEYADHEPVCADEVAHMHNEHAKIDLTNGPPNTQAIHMLVDRVLQHAKCDRRSLLAEEPALKYSLSVRAGTWLLIDRGVDPWADVRQEWLDFFGRLTAHG